MSASWVTVISLSWMRASALEVAVGLQRGDALLVLGVRLGASWLCGEAGPSAAPRTERTQ